MIRGRKRIEKVISEGIKENRTMTKAVRYFSKFGNTKTIAEAIAEGMGLPVLLKITKTEEKGAEEQKDQKTHH